MKTRKLCINECIPYVQKYAWGKGKDGMVYEIMKNIVKENYDMIKKGTGNIDYLKEYNIESEESKNNSKNNSSNSKNNSNTDGRHLDGTAIDETKRKEEINKGGESGSNTNINKYDSNEKYAELWIGNHEKGPNLVLYKNSFIKIEEFIKIFENKKYRKSSKLVNYFYKKGDDKKNKPIDKNELTKSEGVNNNIDIINNIKNNENSSSSNNNNNSSSNNNNNSSSNNNNIISTPSKEAGVKRPSDAECASLKNYSLYETYEMVNDTVDINTLFPYLFKMLSISKPLSIQIHPNQTQTLYLNTVNPLLYKDKIFKTEMCVCINSMSLLCGYMNIFKIAFLIKNINELYNFFLVRNQGGNGQGGQEILVGGREGTEGGKGKVGEMNSSNTVLGKDHNIAQKKRVGNAVKCNTKVNSEKPKDIFLLFDLFHTKKDEHIDEILNMLSRIYVYIINYSLKRANGPCHDIISVVDNYAECIQKYVFDENFFSSFHKNDNFLKENFNLGNLIKTEKEKLCTLLSEHKNILDFNDSDIDEDSDKQKIVSDEVQRSVGNGNLLDASNAENTSVQEGASGGANVETNVTASASANTSRIDGEADNQNEQSESDEPAFENVKKIKAFYEHMYKYVTYRILLVENDALNICVNTIIRDNEKYASYIKEEKVFKKKPEELYADICKKKNYENVCEETEKYIINSIFEILNNVSKYYPNDGGRIFIFILQLLNLKDGDVVYIKPGVIHSYISGHCLECMTNSDLVIRGGLTNKEIDKLNFIKYVNYKNNYPVILEKEFINYNIISYSYHKMKHFKILFIKVRPDESVNYLFSYTSFTSCIVLASNKKVKIKGRKNEKKKASIKSVKKGTVFIIAPNIMVTICNLYSNEEDGDKELVLYCATSR
ncbi:mannose-6-phosphate isomerase, putative [Plasmodium malariae]|uniref:Mannose-6-phosphate isomerase, putative n=1 Tax=Plasmodium malariae TaxID=5858 RepID=A0A1A8VQJ3_PLAMA|nr:mannose-6-phosphate isomerase, putative [Plasmodium malariae]